MTTETAFDGALTRRTAWLVMEGGPQRELPGWRWRRGADEVDHLMVRRCHGPTLDVGCGPGRLTAALRSNGTPTLGIDVSMTAVRMTGRRGGQVLRADVFGSLPDEGGWAGPPFPWALVGADAIAALADATGFRLVWQLIRGGRWFAGARRR